MLFSASLEEHMKAYAKEQVQEQYNIDYQAVQIQTLRIAELEQLDAATTMNKLKAAAVEQKQSLLEHKPILAIEPEKELISFDNMPQLTITGSETPLLTFVENPRLARALSDDSSQRPTLQQPTNPVIGTKRVRGRPPGAKNKIKNKK